MKKVVNVNMGTRMNRFFKTIKSYSKILFVTSILSFSINPMGKSQNVLAGEGTGHHLVYVQEGEIDSLLKQFSQYNIVSVIFDNGEEMPMEYFQDLSFKERNILYPRIYALKISDCFYDYTSED